MSDLIARHNDVLAPVIAFNTKIHAESASGIWVTDPEGNRWAAFAAYRLEMFLLICRKDCLQSPPRSRSEPCHERHKWPVQIAELKA